MKEKSEVSLVPVNRDQSHDLAGLREEAISTILVALLAVAFVVLWLTLLQPLRWRWEPVGVCLALLVTVGATRWSLTRSLVLSALVLLIGIAATITSAIVAYGDGLLSALYPVLAVVAVLLLDWRVAIAVGGFVVSIVFGLAALLPNLLPPSVVALVVLLTGVNLVVAWLLGRPATIALAWAWVSYVQAMEKTEEARARQGELVKLSKNLETACTQLEVANAELERARHAAVEARRLKSEFAATISHELRTPLNLIIGFSQMMVTTPRAYGPHVLPEEYRGDVEAIYRNACHLASLIDDVLDLSQVEAHRLGFKREPSLLTHIVDEALSAVGTLLQDQALSIQVDLAPNLPPLNVDRTRIRQVLINLLNNAARYTLRGGIQIKADLRDGDVVIAVRDSGVGISSDELRHMFEEFHQVNGINEPHHSGLGLAICKRLVELHGGTMWAESVVGQGSTFFFSLPICENVVASSPDQWETWARTVHPGDPTVAVLGGDSDASRLFARFLNRVRIVEVESAEAAAQLQHLTNLKAIIAVGPEGQAELTRLRVCNEFVTQPPIFVCSPRTGQVIGHELGTAAYLTKPVTQEKLLSALRKLGEGISNVAIVDDDPEMVRLLSRMIASDSDSYQIRGMYGGEESLAELLRHPPDVVLLDLLMPNSRVDGYAILAAMRADAQLRDVPVIVISARGAEEETITVDRLEITRPGGLTVGELMECLQASLALLDPAPSPSPAPTPTADLAA